MSRLDDRLREDLLALADALIEARAAQRNGPAGAGADAPDLVVEL